MWQLSKRWVRVGLEQLSPVDESATAAHAIEHLEHVVSVDLIVGLLEVDKHSVGFFVACSREVLQIAHETRMVADRPTLDEHFLVGMYTVGREELDAVGQQLRQRLHVNAHERDRPKVAKVVTRAFLV